MGKTKRDYGNGKKATREKENKSLTRAKKRGEPKFMGFTSGEHSETIGTNKKIKGSGNVWKEDSDFVKYGYPADYRGKKTRKNVPLEKIADKEVKEAIKGEN